MKAPTQIFIHVGYPKTATTWLQQLVFPNHPEIYYCPPKNHKWIKQIAELHDFTFDAKQIQSIYLDSTRDNTIPKVAGVSYEGFILDMLGGGLTSCRSARRLKTVFPEAKIIITLRQQLDMIDSLYRQYIHEGGACSIDKFLNFDPSKRAFLSKELLLYDKMVSYYCDLFGEDSVFVCLYEELSESPQVFCDKMFSFIGVGQLPLNENVLSRKVNVGMSSLSINLARRLNRFMYSDAFNPAPLIPAWIYDAGRVRILLQSHLDPFLSSLFPNFFRRENIKIKPDMLCYLREYYSKGNRVLAEKYQLPLDKYGYPV